MDWTRFQLLTMGSNQKDVTRKGVFLICKLYECFFMPIMEAIGGTNI
jgi:hypothetical protein